MEQKFTDYQDYDHLVNTLQNDFQPLLNKIAKIEERINRTYSIINKGSIKSNEEKWVNPKSKNSWKIFYTWSIQKNKILVSFIPYSEFHYKKDEKVYLILKQDAEGLVSDNLIKKNRKRYNSKTEIDFNEFLQKNGWGISIFRGHFLNQFRTRTNNHKHEALNIFQEFSLFRQFSIVQLFIQNENWLMSLHKYGVAMIRANKNFVVYETFVNDLYPEQIMAIKEHIDKLDDKSCTLIGLYLMENEMYNSVINFEIVRENLVSVIKRTHGGALNFASPILSEIRSKNIDGLKRLLKINSPDVGLGNKDQYIIL